MSHRERDVPELKLAITIAKWKAAAAVYCANVLRPEAQCIIKGQRSYATSGSVRT